MTEIKVKLSIEQNTISSTFQYLMIKFLGRRIELRLRNSLAHQLVPCIKLRSAKYSPGGNYSAAPD